MNAFKVEEEFSKEKKKLREKVINFNKEAVNCKDFTMKQEELRVKIFWCKKIDKPCLFRNCPKINKQK